MGVGSTFLKSLAGAGAALGSTLFEPDEAEAMPIGKMAGRFKTFAEAMVGKGRVAKEMKRIGQIEPAVSSTNKVLKGMDFQGSKIAGVYQGGGKKRYIHLEDGRIFPTDRASLHDLSAERGTQQYIDIFKKQDEGAQWDMIQESYKMNERRGVSPLIGGSKPTRRQIIENHLLDRQSMTAAELADQVLVQSVKSKKWWLWPRAYAEPAEAAGMVRIDKKWNFLKELNNGQTK